MLGRFCREEIPSFMLTRSLVVSYGLMKSGALDLYSTIHTYIDTAASVTERLVGFQELSFLYVIPCT